MEKGTRKMTTFTSEDRESAEKFAKNFELIFGKKEKVMEPIPFAGMVDTGEDDEHSERSE